MSCLWIGKSATLLLWWHTTWFCCHSNTFMALPEFLVLSVHVVALFQVRSFHLNHLKLTILVKRYKLLCSSHYRRILWIVVILFNIHTPNAHLNQRHLWIYDLYFAYNSALHYSQIDFFTWIMWSFASLIKKTNLQTIHMIVEMLPLLFALIISSFRFLIIFRRSVYWLEAKNAILPLQILCAVIFFFSQALSMQ